MVPLKTKRLRREAEDYRKHVIWCVMCRGKHPYKAMPESTTCLKHKPPTRRTIARKLMELSVLNQEGGKSE